MLANIYLHYVFDLWAERWRRHHALGNVILVRYADDIVAGFEHRADAERFQEELRDRLAQFALTLHPDKTRLIQFGRRAAAERERSGLGKPETFDFLGFTHICGRSLRGRFLLFRRTRRDRKRAKVREVKEELRRRMDNPIPSQGQWLRQVVTGFFAYHAVPTNLDALAAFRYHIIVLWMRMLTRRSQKDRTGWDRINKLADQWLPKPRSFTHGPTSASPSNIQGGSRMRECRTSGSVRGVPSNGHPYRNPIAWLSSGRWPICSWRAGIYCAVCRRNVSAIGRQTQQTPQCWHEHNPKPARFVSSERLAMPKSKLLADYSDVP